MGTFSVWKTFEMNETLEFHGVTEMTFPSIKRRSLIVNCKARFVGAQRLASLPLGTQGYFLMQEDRKDFVTCGGRGPPPGRRRSRSRFSSRRGRGGDHGGEAGTWLAAGGRRGATCLS